MLGKKRNQSAVISIPVAVLILLAAGCGPSKPVIKRVTPDKGLIGTGFKIRGTFFGKTQEKSTVTIASKKTNVVSWSDTTITATVPLTLTAGTYPVVVKTTGGPSNKVSYTVYATFTGPTPLPAMLEFLKSRKVVTKGLTFTAVATSKTDPTWKLDKAVASDGTTYYFLFHKTKDGWTIKDFGTGFTADQMKIVGAPGDLKPPS
jgi:hypothetical protein